MTSMFGSPSLASVVISSNDNGNGVLLFLSSSVNVSEDQQGSILNVTRHAGLFGQVCVILLNVLISYSIS